VSLAVYAALTGSLTPSVAFVSLGVFKALEVTLSVVPELTTDLLDAWVSVKRIEEYLKSPEISKVAKPNDEVVFDSAAIAWPADEKLEDAERFVLRDVTVTFPKGELSVISGKTGTGKSLMLAAILGEVDILSGSIYVPEAPPMAERHDSKATKANWIIPNAIAYVAQIPWIENASIKDNITFGLPFDEERYKKTVEVCALKKDLEMLSDGESTEIGANGINLSGGQKWRVTLARAIYSRAGILVMDDIFSAVDAHVGRHIFEKCLNGELAAGRTRILVTHHVALCESKTKYLVELGDGRVLNAGLLSELQEDGTLQNIKSHEQTDDELREDEAITAVNSDDSTDGEDDAQNGVNGNTLKKVTSKSAADPRKFVEEEKREEGAVKRHIYGIYLKASGGVPFWTVCVFIFLLVESFRLGESGGSIAFLIYVLTVCRSIMVAPDLDWGVRGGEHERVPYQCLEGALLLLLHQPPADAFPHPDRPERRPPRSLVLPRRIRRSRRHLIHYYHLQVLLSLHRVRQSQSETLRQAELRHPARSFEMARHRPSRTHPQPLHRGLQHH